MNEKRFTAFPEVKKRKQKNIFSKLSPFIQMGMISSGSVLGDYKLVAPSGPGGFGFVFRVSSTGHPLGEKKPSADFALKIASPRIDESAFVQALRRSTDAPRYEVPYNPFRLTGIKADTFAIATILGEMILGRHPFAHLSHPHIYSLLGLSDDDNRSAMEKHLQMNDFAKSLPPAISHGLVD